MQRGTSEPDMMLPVWQHQPQRLLFGKREAEPGKEGQGALWGDVPWASAPGGRPGGKVRL